MTSRALCHQIHGTEEVIVPVLSVAPGFNEEGLSADLQSIFGQSPFLKVVIDTATVIEHPVGDPAAEAAGVRPTVPGPVDAAKGTNR